MRILQSPTARRSGATIAQVTFSENGSFGAVSSAEQRRSPVFAPRGIAFSPCEGDQLLLIEADGREVCAGVLCVADGLVGGELRLSSSGGACIHLRNNGEIVLNGLTVTREGKLREA